MKAASRGLTWLTFGIALLGLIALAWVKIFGGYLMVFPYNLAILFSPIGCVICFYAILTGNHDDRGTLVRGITAMIVNAALCFSFFTGR